MLAGRAADLYGRRRLFMLGLGLFAAASLGCGVTDAPAPLVVARSAQGLGAALVTAAVARSDAVADGGGPTATALVAGYRWAFTAGAGLATLAAAVTVLVVREGGFAEASRDQAPRG